MMKKAILLPALFLVLGSFTQAQVVSTDNVYNLHEINWQLDSLMPCYHFRPVDSADLSRAKLNIHGYAPDSLPAYSTDIVAQRLKDIGSLIDLEYNEHVQAYINMYTITRRDQVERLLQFRLCQKRAKVEHLEAQRAGVTYHKSIERRELLTRWKTPHEK